MVFDLGGGTRDYLSLVAEGVEYTARFLFYNFTYFSIRKKFEVYFLARESFLVLVRFV
jgi:hypothetical protein